MKNERIYERDTNIHPHPELLTKKEKEDLLKKIKELDFIMRTQECFTCRLSLRDIRIHIKKDHGR